MRTVLFHRPRFGPVARFVLLVIAAWCLSSAAPSPARGPYRIGYAPGARIHVEARNRLEAVYGRAGLAVEFVPLPQKRSLVQAVDGVIDGDVGRIPGLERKFPTLVRVDVKLMDLVGVAYVIKGQRIGDYRPELLATLRAGAVRGVLWAEKIMDGRRLEQVNTYETLFGMLLAGRIDLALGSRRSAEDVFRTNRARYARIRELEPPVYHVPFYHYVNIRNADIVPRLEKALRELRAEDYWHDEAGQ
ncbi:substrate-binding periplasmic protein [Pseudodesulfovibrio methanolicus]|uniref:Solute-binding protein family 3/N-terminal domain-containing protein n=1 Tax=Pseudodesulfovibrio methanolicus TaxID=3126690 RepID=A0ABZ2J545_9BACT